MKLQDKILDVYINRGISLTENQKYYYILNEDKERDINDLESRIFNFFYEDFKKSSETNLSKYLESKDFAEYFGDSKYLKFFESLGISLEDLYKTWKENNMKLRFKEYVGSILIDPKFNLIKKLRENSMDKISEGVLFPEDNVSDKDIRNAKEEIIQKALDSEDVNLDSVSDEELDTIMGELIKVDEKIRTLLKYRESLDNDALVECIKKYTGMHLDESKEVLDYYRNN